MVPIKSTCLMKEFIYFMLKNLSNMSGCCRFKKHWSYLSSLSKRKHSQGFASRKCHCFYFSVFTTSITKWVTFTWGENFIKKLHVYLKSLKPVNNTECSNMGKFIFVDVLYCQSTDIPQKSLHVIGHSFKINHYLVRYIT